MAQEPTKRRLNPQQSPVDLEVFLPGSLEAQMVKNLPAMQETWVRSLG